MKKKTLEQLIDIIQHSDVTLEITPVLYRTKTGKIKTDYNVKTLLRGSPTPTCSPGNELKFAPGTQTTRTVSLGDYEHLGNLAARLAEVTYRLICQDATDISADDRTIFESMLHELNTCGFTHNVDY